MSVISLPRLADDDRQSLSAKEAEAARESPDAYILLFIVALLVRRNQSMTNDQQPVGGTTALQVACDTAVSGCVFLMRTEEDDKDQLLAITRDHVREQHGKEYTLDEIEDRHVNEIEV